MMLVHKMNRKKGGEYMTNTALLEDKIRQSGKKKGYLAERIGLTIVGFRRCCINKAEFRANQIKILSEELGITDLNEREKIFFA